MISADDWENAGYLLEEMSMVYTRDNLRKLTFNNEIFPLVLRFENGDRSPDLYVAILNSQRVLMRDIYREAIGTTPLECFFMNPQIKPVYSDVLLILGKEQENWKALVDFLKTDLRLKVHMKFYGEEGWVVEFNRAGKPQLLLVPDKDNFKIILPSRAKDGIDANTVNNIREIFPLISRSIGK